MELIAGKTSESLKRHPIQEGKSMSKKIKPQWGTGVRQKHHKIKKDGLTLKFANYQIYITTDIDEY